MDADLVTRLRCWLDEDTPIGVIMNEAAARIAQLEAALRAIADSHYGHETMQSIARAALGEKP